VHVDFELAYWACQEFFYPLQEIPRIRKQNLRDSWRISADDASELILNEY